jgi:hypothetical protein
MLRFFSSAILNPQSKKGLCGQVFFFPGGKQMAAGKQAGKEGPSPRVSKKEQILSLYKAGITDVTELAAITVSRASYVASVLQDVQGLPSYFDLYTSTSQPMNIYSKYFAGKLGFRDQESAQQSVDLIQSLYQQFDLAGDRAGQHHALLMALTMFDRARWTGKAEEAEIFRRWLLARLEEAEPAADRAPPEPVETRVKGKPRKKKG